MKKNLIQIIILAILLGIVIVAQIVPLGNSRIMDMLKINKKGTIKELRDFSIEDTSRITRIFMVDKENKTLDLTREPGNKWIVNDKYRAKKYDVNLLIGTMHSMRIKSPVATSAEENIIKRLATKSVKVEVYDNEDLLKTYYIGGVTQNQTGTYAMLEGSTKPFIVEIPGFRGYLTSRFHTVENLWRSARVFQFDELEIEKIAVKVGSKPNQSFSIIINDKNNYELLNANDQKAKAFDTLAVRRFVKEFKNKSFSRFLSTELQEKADSVYNSKLFYKFNVDLKSGLDVEVSLHKVKDFVADDIMEIDYMNGIVNQTLWVTVQTHLFATLFRELNDFKPVF
ncbi:MAG: hypothetical protein C0599_01330 [Salinivirgaceae bacterium]|nr:MAG: hypothetical protein C0599_01330 [Salinivirgaceae bacterium]